MSDVDARMEALRRRFRDRAVADRAAIAAALDDGDRARLLYLVHGLAGIAGIFGHPHVGAAASAVEEAIDAGAPDDQVAGLAGALTEALDAVVGAKAEGTF